MGLRADQGLQGRQPADHAAGRAACARSSSRSSTPTASTPPARPASSRARGNGEDGTFYDASPTSPNEYRRKNCRLVDESQTGNCAQPAFGVASIGVDPNRNYGGFWGGAGASDVADRARTTAARARSPSPRRRTSATSSPRRQVTMLITNHTFSNLVLRPPGLASDPRRSTSRSTRRSATRWRPRTATSASTGYELYDTSGGTEDWSYYATGGLGFTFEIYCNHIPDPIDDALQRQLPPDLPEDGRRVRGHAPAPTRRRAAAATARPTSSPSRRRSTPQQALGARGRGAPRRGPDAGEELHDADPQRGAAASPRTTSRASSRCPTRATTTGTSTPRPGRSWPRRAAGQAQGPPSDPLAVRRPARHATTPSRAASSFDTDRPDLLERPRLHDSRRRRRRQRIGHGRDRVDQPGQRLGPQGLPRHRRRRHVATPTAGRRRADAAESASRQLPPGTNESTTFVAPETGDGRLEPGNYVARVINYATVTPDPYTLEVTFEGPEEFVPPKTETWKLTCSVGGQVVGSQDLLIARGETKQLNPCPASTGRLPAVWRRQRRPTARTTVPARTRSSAPRATTSSAARRAPIASPARADATRSPAAVATTAFAAAPRRTSCAATPATTSSRVAEARTVSTRGAGRDVVRVYPRRPRPRQLRLRARQGLPQQGQGPRPRLREGSQPLTADLLRAQCADLWRSTPDSRAWISKGGTGSR